MITSTVAKLIGACLAIGLVLGTVGCSPPPDLTKKAPETPNAKGKMNTKKLDLNPE